MKRSPPIPPKSTASKTSSPSKASNASNASKAPKVSKASRPPAATQQRASRAPIQPRPPVKPTPHSTSSKQSQLITLLRSVAGATMQQMETLTGWQPHTVRSVLSGSLRKRLGLDVRPQRVAGVRVYRIVKGPAL